MINSNQTMVSGSFGIAWLNDDKIISVFDANSVTQPVPNIKVNAILAADVLEEGSEQLLFLDEAKKALHIYSFKTKKLLGPFGSNIKTFATGRWSDKESFPSVFVSTFAGQAFRWTREIMEKGWEPLAGYFEQITAGKSKSSNMSNDFAVVCAGNVYLFSPKWKTYSQLLEGKEIVAALYGNVTNSSGDELVLLDKKGNLLLYQNSSVESLGISNVRDFTFGKNGDGLDTLYALDVQKKPVKYNRESKTWKDVFAENAFACSALVTQTNGDGGEGHTLYVVRDGNLYRFNVGGKAEQLSEQSANAFLKTAGKTVADYRYINVPFKPYIEKLRTPSGRNVLRDAPHDHLHHHGLMFAVAVDGCNFWEEYNNNAGKEITTSLLSKENVLNSELDWKNSKSEILLTEKRKIMVSESRVDEKSVTLLDWQSVFSPPTGRTAHFDKSNHHYFGLGLRFDQTMDKEGRFFNSNGNVGEVFRGDERLTTCNWMAYTAKLNGEPVTVAMFGRLENSIPTVAFTMGETGKSFAYMSITLNFHRQPLDLKPDTTLTLDYRVAVWDGEVSAETIEKAYQEYATIKF
jgi:hypothetical protein